jgi:hypothetical protein
MKRISDAYLGKNPARYGQEVIQGLKVKEPPVDEYDVADFLGYEIREVTEDDIIDFLQYKSQEAGEEKCAEWKRLFRTLQTACAHLLKEENIICVTRDMYPLRKRTSIFHECGHDRTPWHDALAFSCTEKALELTYHQRVEREAFLCGAEIQMPRQLFIPDILALPVGIDAIEALAKRYKASFETTAIRYAQMNRRLCAVVVIEPAEIVSRRIEQAQCVISNQLTLELNDLILPPANTATHSSPFRVKYCIRSPYFPFYIPPRKGIAEGNAVFEVCAYGIPKQDVVPASAFGSSTAERFNADIRPFGSSGFVMALLWLPDHQLAFDSADMGIL